MSVSADNEWSPLRSVIVGRAKVSCFPNEPEDMVDKTMPKEHRSKFFTSKPFPLAILQKADQELDNFAVMLEREGVTVSRPAEVDWLQHRGYTCAMPRDGLITIGNTIIEACFAWRSRSCEISLGFSKLLEDLSADPMVTVARASKLQGPDTIYDKAVHDKHQLAGWAINDSRPAFDAADFMRFGKTILGQLSHVTNLKGVEYVRSKLPPGYSVELLRVSDPSAMHIDATILPLRKGLLVYHPGRVTEDALREHSILKTWDMHKYPFVPEAREYPPLYMTSPWLAMNLLVLDGTKVFVEAMDTELAEWLRGLGMAPILCPFRHVHSLGGSFHCATVDLVRTALP